MPGESLKGHLDMLLLSVLRGAPAHGYAVVERLAEVSEGAFDLGEGTVYPALRRLEKAGLLRSSWKPANGRDRRVYEVTAKGEKALAKQRSRVGCVLGGRAPHVGNVRVSAEGPQPSPVEAYLRRLSRRLGVVPHRRSRVLREARDHLLAATESGIARGLSLSDAEAQAVDRFGPAGQVARHEIREAGALWASVVAGLAAVTVSLMVLASRADVHPLFDRRLPPKRPTVQLQSAIQVPALGDLGCVPERRVDRWRSCTGGVALEWHRLGKDGDGASAT